MKLIILAVFAFAAVSASPISFLEEQADWEIDMDVVPMQDLPGFWDGRDPILVQNYQQGQKEAEFFARNPRIVGGTNAPHGSRPFQVAQHRGGGLCGGSLIRTRTIVTAAHCMTGTGALTAIAGAHNRNVVEPQQQRRTIPHSAANTRMHPSYNPSNLNNDIGVFQVPTTLAAFTQSATVGFIGMAPTGAGTFAGAMAVISGWGRTTNTGPASATLNQVSRAVITNAVCSQTFGGTIVGTTMCTATPGGSCNGDSGGPVTTGGQLIGAVSFGSGGGCNTAPSGHARISSFNTWINNNALG